ncbi:glycosyltransferase [Bacillus sp. S35]|nr:glycosyltransferase [Bacillus sp. S35]NLR42238.1 glycosyltransferase [Priestia megaterium]
MCLMKNAVILFVYNRPQHTQRVIEGLKKNHIEKLYVFSDGAAKEVDQQLVNDTRNLIKNIDWCEVEAVYHTNNKGLAESVINGVTQVFSKGYERVIVLEDDCVPNENFVSFMNSAFDYYENDDEIMHVSGFGLPINKYTNSDTYFTPYPCSWGWGTWSKYWKECDFYQHSAYKELLENEVDIKKFNYAGQAFSAFLEAQIQGKVNSWLIRWYYHIFINNGKCVWSYESLIKNKGFDGTGAHKVKYDRFNQKNICVNKSEFVFENNKKINSKLIKEFRRYFIGRSMTEKIKTILYQLTGLIV